jgi:1-acyl-sn-glycerol-3-phosphate acyltransferase
MLVLGLIYIFIAFVFGYKAAAYSGIPWLWGRLFCLFTTTRLVVKGKRNIPKNVGVVFLFTHSSFMDIPALFGSTGGLINFAASEFVLKIPVMGTVMRVVKTIVITQDREESIRQYKLAEVRLKEGDRFMISPEGGRSDGEEILPFKSGPFIFAMNAHATFVPVVVHGAYKTWPKGDLMPNMRQFFNTIHVEYMPPVSTKDFTPDNRKQKAEEIRQDMLKVFNKYKLAHNNYDKNC